LDILKKVQKILFGLTSASSQQRQRNLANLAWPNPANLNSRQNGTTQRNNTIRTPRATITIRHQCTVQCDNNKS